MEFPSINEVQDEISSLKNDMILSKILSKKDYVDIRLQIISEKSWLIHTGDHSFDTDHHGSWGGSVLCKDSNCYELASELINQCKDHYFS